MIETISMNFSIHNETKNLKQIKSEIYDSYLCMLNIVTAQQQLQPQQQNNNNCSWVETK